MDYEYRSECPALKSLLAVGIIVLIAAVLIALVTLISNKSGKDKLISLEQGMKYVCNPLTAVLLITCVVFIAGGYVSTYTIDNVFALVSVVLLGVVLFYAINHNREGQPQIISKIYIKEHIGDLIQSIAIAGVMQSCCEYVAGLYDINHEVAERKEMLWFALIIIAMFSAKEIFNILNLCYVLAACVGGFFYYRANVTPEMGSDELFVLKGTVGIAILLGLILIRTVIRFIRKKPVSKISIPVAVVTLIYLALTVVFRNTRWWTVVLAVAILLLTVNYIFWDKKDNFLTNVIRGIVIQFMYVTVWCWLYRPYCTYRCARYTFFFHTETIAATYLTIVSTAFLVLLIAKIRKNTMSVDENGKNIITGKIRLADIWKELALFATAIAYLLFTFSRTAYLTAVVTLVFAFILMLFGTGFKYVKHALTTMLWLGLAVLIMLPIVFEIQRTIPCIVSEPYEYDIDNYEDEVMRGRRLSTDKYMTVGRLVDIFCDKILGIPDGSIDLYKNKINDFDENNATMLEIAENYDFYWRDYDITDEEWDNLPSTEHWQQYIYRFGIPEDELTNLVGWYSDTDGDSEYSGLPVPIYAYELEDTDMESGIADVTKIIPEDAEEYYDEYMKDLEKHRLEGKDESEYVKEVNIKKEEEEETEEVEETVEESEDVTESADISGSGDYTNGRMSIYKSYLEQLNLTGHDHMGAILEDGKEATHAHDVFLQVAFDHGIPTALVFLLFLGFTFITAIVFYVKNKKEHPETALTASAMTAFAVAGLVEWTYSLGHPMTVVMWLSIVPLIFATFKKKEKRADK